MQHLNEEDLARLVDDAPGPEEASHLEACSHCRAELEALREQTRLLASLPELHAPERVWRGVAARLEAEGLLRPADARVEWRRQLLRVAAALALFVSGGALGATLRGGAEPPAAEVAAAAPVPRSVEEAAQRLRAAEAAYLAALGQYSEASGAAQSTDPVNRLAALEGIVLTTRAALKEAPADPVINGYHLTALGQRDALLRQIDATTPASADQPWY